ncbi:hypothetical protein [Pseudomonas sp. IC_126]|nr:hypothetical protein [Pseudomonas sp. IC_126]
MKDAWGSTDMWGRDLFSSVERFLNSVSSAYRNRTMRPRRRMR